MGNLVGEPKNDNYYRFCAQLSQQVVYETDILCEQDYMVISTAKLAQMKVIKYLVTSKNGATTTIAKNPEPEAKTIQFAEGTTFEVKQFRLALFP